MATTLDERVTFARVIRSEWTKLSSLRSTWIIVGVCVVASAGLSAAFGHGFAQGVRSGDEVASLANAIDVTYIGLDLFALVLGVLGVLQITGEYGSGLIRASLTAVPRRWPLLPAKALVLALTVAATMVPAAMASFLLAQRLAGQGVSLGDPGTLRAVLGAGLYPVATALLGLGIGAALRGTALAITVYVSVMFLVPALLSPALPEAVERAVLPYVPIAAAQAVYTADPGTDPFQLLSPGAGLLVLAGWIALVIGAGTAALYRRDV